MTDTPEEQHKTIMDEAERLLDQIRPLGFNDNKAPDRHLDALKRAAERRMPDAEFEVNKMGGPPIADEKKQEDGGSTE